MPAALLKDAGVSRSLCIHEEAGDPPNLRDTVGLMFEEWMQLVSQKSNQGAVMFITRLVQQELLKTDDISTCFFRLCTDFAVRFCYPPQTP